MIPRFAVVILFTALAAPAAQAQSIVTLVKQGQTLTGIGNVTGIQRVAINDNGDWLVEVDTDNANMAIDEVLIHTGTVYQQQGTPVVQPSGASHLDFVSQSLHPNNGDAAYIWSLTGTTGTTDNAGVYYNQQLLIQKGSTPLASGWGAGTTHNGLSWAKLNNANQLFLRGNTIDPTSTPTADWFASIVDLDPITHVPTAETLIARAGQILPGQTTFGVNTVGSGQDASGFNNLGQALYRVSLSGAPTTSDAAVYVYAGGFNVLLAQEGLPSPVAGINWGDLLAPELALNDAGDYLIKDLLDTASATDGIIVKNGAKFIQEGDTLPAIGGVFLFTTFGNAPVSLTAAGNVCWYGDWNDALTTVDTGIFVDQTLVVKEGVTQTVNGLTFNALLTAGTSATAGQNNLLYISPNGRFVIFSGRTSDNLFGAFVLDRGTMVASFCPGDGSGTPCPCANSGASGNGCANSINAAGANLAATGTASVSAANLVLTATGMGDSSCLFFQGTIPVSGGAGVTFGDGLRCVGGTVIRLGTSAVIGGTAQYPEPGDPPVATKGMIPASGGVTRYYQCWYRHAQMYCMPETFNLTNGISATWGL